MIENKNVTVINEFTGGSSFLPSSDFLQKNQNLETARELFDPKKIEKITDLSKDEIKLVTRMQTMAYIKNLSIWIKGLDFYMSLMLSANRQSRKELISVLAGSREKKDLGTRLKKIFKPTE